MSAGYSGTPLGKKLGVKPGSTVLLINAPELPDLDDALVTATVYRRLGRGPYDVAVVFCPDRAFLLRRFEPVAARLTMAGALWICWPKKASGIRTDLTDNDVRADGLAAGLVDVKVAAIDATWSGLKFVRRLADR